MMLGSEEEKNATEKRSVAEKLFGKYQLKMRFFV
jgi:hypothetical protein